DGCRAPACESTPQPAQGEHSRGHVAGWCARNSRSCHEPMGFVCRARRALQGDLLTLCYLLTVAERQHVKALLSQHRESKAGDMSQAGAHAIPGAVTNLWDSFVGLDGPYKVIY